VEGITISLYHSNNHHEVLDAELSASHNDSQQNQISSFRGKFRLPSRSTIDMVAAKRRSSQR